MIRIFFKLCINREVFERECSGYPGFITKFRVTEKSSGNDTDTVDFENYRFEGIKNVFFSSKTCIGMCVISGITKLPRLWLFVWRAKTLSRSEIA